MFPLRLVHPKHGATHAHDSSEAERLKKQGWSEPVTASKPEVQALTPKRAYRKKAA